jgi:O-antigen/teichoic acid export membrane protein
VAQRPRREARAEFAGSRFKFLALCGVGTALLVSTADIAARILYDERYEAATWMLPVLVLGAWLSMLVQVNEAVVLGFGRPAYAAFANGAKSLLLMTAVPLCLYQWGILAGIAAVAVADAARYVPIMIGQRRESFSFVRQDLVLTLLTLACIVLFETLRWAAGFGTSLSTVLAGSR